MHKSSENLTKAKNLQKMDAGCTKLTSRKL